jgi:hypothetical protein
VGFERSPDVPLEVEAGPKRSEKKRKMSNTVFEMNLEMLYIFRKRPVSVEKKLKLSA